VNLQEAGAQALERCKELVTHAEDAAKRVEDIDESVQKLKDQLHTDWDHALEKSQQLLSRLKAERHELEGEAHAAQSLLRELHTKMSDAESQMVSAVQQLLEEVNALEQGVGQQQPHLQEALEQVHEVGRSLKSKSDDVHGQLETTAQEAEEHLGDQVASAIGEIEQAHTARVDQLEEHIESSALPEMEQHHEQLHGQIDEYKGSYEQAVESAHEKAQQAASDSLSEATEKHQDVFQQFGQIGSEAKQLMDALKGGIDAGAETVGSVEEAMKAGVNATSVGLRAAIGTLEELMKFFQHFSFIKL
jgi:chromosome segregation ATPase